jgi:hypothetical protein
MAIIEPKPRKRRWQFSLLSFLIAVNISAVAAAVTARVGLQIFGLLCLLAYLNPLFVLIYITIEGTIDWWQERARRSFKRKHGQDRAKSLDDL